MDTTSGHLGKKWPFVAGAIAVMAVVIGGLLVLQTYLVQPPAPPVTNTTQPAGPAAANAEAAPSNWVAPDFPHDDPAKIDNSSFDITPVDKLHITGVPQSVDIATYRLRVDGLVSSPLSLTYERIMQYPTVTETVLLICPYAFWDNATWTGVPMKALLAEAGVKQGASKVTFYSLDGYDWELPLGRALQDGVYLAHTVNGQVIPRQQGYPLRLVVKGETGNKWVKWIDHIEVN